MAPKRTLVALVLALMIAGVAVAQSDAPAASSSEFDRASGGQIDVLTKQARKLSGSLGMTMSSGDFSGRGYEATLGGTVLQDRLWFFAAASMLPEMPQRSSAGAFDAKVDASLGSRHSLGASFRDGRSGVATTPAALADPFASSFLSLRYTGTASSSLLFNASFSRHSAARTDGAFTPFGPTQ